MVALQQILPPTWEMIDNLRGIMLVQFLVLGAMLIKLNRMVCPNPADHPKTQAAMSYERRLAQAGEECKLHSRKLAECMKLGWHTDNTQDEEDTRDE